MKVFSGLNPNEMMSLAFLKANSLHCSSLRSGLNRNFSSSAWRRESGQPRRRAGGESTVGALAGQLDHQWAVEHLLEPLSEDERDAVAEVHAVG